MTLIPITVNGISYEIDPQNMIQKRTDGKYSTERSVKRTVKSIVSPPANTITKYTIDAIEVRNKSDDEKLKEFLFVEFKFGEVSTGKLLLSFCWISNGVVNCSLCLLTLVNDIRCFEASRSEIRHKSDRRIQQPKTNADI